jgi:hypothetical protein
LRATLRLWAHDVGVVGVRPRQRHARHALDRRSPASRRVPVP